MREPIIHSFNKNETVVHELPIYEDIKERKNVLLLGDTLGDVHMADGFAYEHIIKVWFLNHETPELKEAYSKIYDVVIMGDGNMKWVNELIQKII